MSYHLLIETERTTAKPHQCIWCGERIEAGERYLEERSVYDGRVQHHHWHPACKQAAEDGWLNGDDTEFIPYSQERAPTAGDLEFESWDCAALAQGRLL